MYPLSMYYPCSKKKGADQLCSNCTADLRLSFRICKKRISQSDDEAHVPSAAHLRGVHSCS